MGGTMNRFNVIFGVVATVALALGITAMVMASSSASSASRDSAAATAQQRTATAQLRTQVRAVQVVQGKNTAALGADTAARTRMGVCWNVSYGSANGDYGTYAESVSIDAPIVTAGVTTCPQGDTFAPVG
jgi:hypothetical protein